MKLLTTAAFTARYPWHNPSNHLDVVRKYLFKKIQCFVSFKSSKTSITPISKFFLRLWYDLLVIWTYDVLWFGKDGFWTYDFLVNFSWCSYDFLLMFLCFSYVTYVLYNSRMSFLCCLCLFLQHFVFLTGICLFFELEVCIGSFMFNHFKAGDAKMNLLIFTET